MKHLKFFESHRLSDIGYLCNTYLSFIKDERYKVDINGNRLFISSDDDSDINYNKIKDDFIPFIQIMKDSYDINIMFTGYESSRLSNLYRGKDIRKVINIDDLIFDSVKINYELRLISVRFTQTMPDDIKKFIKEYISK